MSCYKALAVLCGAYAIMPRASWFDHKIHCILLESGCSGCSQTKSKQAGPGDRLRRDNREKNGSKGWTTQGQAWNLRYHRLSIKGYVHKYMPLSCSREKEDIDLNAMVYISLMPSQYPVSTFSFPWSPNSIWESMCFPRN